MIISIWGFMGSGKSTLGKYIADTYGWQQVDSDEEIEKKEGKSISNIFKEHGEEEYFRDLETQFLRQLLAKKERGELSTNILLTTGGGMPLRAENRELLQKLGLNVFLDVPFEEMARRLQADKTRPLWDETQLVSMEKKYNERLPIYRQAHISLVPKNISQLAEEIVQLVHKWEQNGGK